MRLTSVTLAFIFFGTVFATPIHPLRGQAVELSKRSGEGETMTGLGDAGASDGGGGDESNRGRQRTRGSRKGKGRVTTIAEGEGDGSDAETSVSPSGAKKRTKKQTSRSTSSKRTKSQGSQSRGNLVSRAVFLAALRDIKQEGAAGVGSQSLGVFHINQLVNGRKAVVKIIDDRIDPSAVRVEAGRLNHVGHLFGWGRRKVAPKHFYLLMENMGERVDKMEGLDPTTPEGGKYINDKKAAALEEQQNKHKLTHKDPAGNDNYLWQHNKDAAAGEDAYTVNVVDWAGAEATDPEGTYAKAPTLFEVPSDIFAPKESPKSSKKGTSSPSDGNSDGKTTPPKRTASGHSGERTGLRSQKAGTSGTSGQV